MTRSFLFLLSLSCLLISACTSSIRISVLTPAAIDLPSDVEQIVVLNNTRIDTDKKEDMLEAILTGEQVKGDSKAAEEATRGIVTSIRERGNYHANEIKGFSVKNEDMSIKWDTIEQVCRENESQAMIILDFLDTDAPIGGTVTGNILGATGSSLHGRGFFSVYYPEEKLLHEMIDVRSVYHIPTSGSMHPLDILIDVTAKRNYIKKMGFQLGYEIGTFFYPAWIWVNREYYGSGNKDLRHAKRMIRSGNWDLAEKKLKPLLDARKRKVRKKATFNMALVYEGQGKLEKALKMAEKAALEYNAKPAYEYINKLENRMAEIRLIEWQKGN